MPLMLYHHPQTRAATVVWMLEELGEPYELVYVDMLGAQQKSPEHLSRNPMGKVPVLEDGEALVTESAAIGVYLADRYAPGRLAPALDDPRRGTFLRWCFYAPSVIEPGCMAKAAKWAFKPGRVGWGTHEEMLSTLEAAIGDGPWLLGKQFTMADVVLGGTVRWMLQFGMLEPRPTFTAYRDRLEARPGAQRARAVNERVLQEHRADHAE